MDRRIVIEFRTKLLKEKYDFNNYLLSFNERRITLKLIERYLYGEVDV